MDVHKEMIDVSMYKENDSRPYCEKRIPNRDTSIKKLFKGIMKTGSVVAFYEAGCMGFTLQRTLEGMGVTAVIAAPGKMPRRSSDRVKTDRRDGVPRRPPFLWVKVPPWQLPVQPCSEECMGEG
jgi:hypothetical protein